LLNFDRNFQDIRLKDSQEIRKHKTKSKQVI